jgi:hypothetical protein
MSNRKLYISILCLFWVSLGVKAQQNNTNLETFQYIDSTKSKQFWFHFESFNFIKNNEYFLNIADGYTLFGNQFLPKISYHPAKNVIVETGVYAWKDYGNDSFSKIQPIFSIKIQNDSSQFIFGNLEGNLNHRLVEPMMNFERVILNRQETGIQYTRRKNKTFFDGWIDWQNMIYKGSNTKETFFAGFSWNKKIINRPNFYLSVPWQMTFQHRGGQITHDTAQVITNINTAIGVEAAWRMNGFLQKIKLQNYWLGYRQNSNHHPYFPEGSGVYLNVSAETKWLNVMLSYWQSKGYLSDAGGDLYQSVGRVFKAPNTVEKERKILIIRLMKDWKVIDNLWFSIRFEPYFDLLNHEFEHSEGLFLTYRQNFKL